MTTIEFSKAVKATLGLRASYICVNPSCHALTITLAGYEAEKIVYRGRAVAICGPEGGHRHDPKMTAHQRKAIDNAIFLCVRCADSVNRNRGGRYTAELLRDWKERHKQWVRTHLNLRRQRLGRPAAVSIESV